VGAGESQCAVCGASTTSPGTPQRPRPVADRETMRFARAVLERPYKFTIILLVANFFVFLLMWQSSGMTSNALWEFHEPVLVAYGAKLNRLINEQHQWWRFVSPMFVHVNLPHLLVNMYSLWIVGPYVEKLYGSAKFLVFWVVTGVAGVIASYLTVVSPDSQLGSLGRFLLKTNDLPSAGASGALFGLVGILFVFGIKFRHELPEGFKRAFGTGMLPIIVINLFIGYLGRGLIDNAAHLGGLVSGAALALLVEYRRPGERTGVAITWQVLRIAAIAVVVVSFFKVSQHFPHPLPVPVIAQANRDSSGKAADFVGYARVIHDAQDAFYDTTMNNDPKGIDTAVKGLESVPHLDEESDQLAETLKALLIAAKELKTPSTSTPEADTKKVQQKEKELMQGLASWKNSYDRWLKTTGKTHGGLIDLSTPQTPGS
jgi:membrane associated rhomboid family serine protease